MKQSKHKLFKLLMCSSVAMGAVLSALTPAQAEGLQLEEIVVTAEKRDVSLQNVSIAVSAITKDQMERAGLADINNIALKVPSLQISGPGGIVWTYMRGAGNVNPTVAGDNGVAFHYDGVYMSAATAALANMYDVERVEVLRGPQGTLYGRNSTGGSINVITTKPREEFEASVDLSYGNYDAKQIRGMINLPKTGIMRSRITATWSDRDGYQKNIGPSGQTDLDKAKDWTIRGSLGFDFSDATVLDVKLLGSETNGPATAPRRLGGYAPIHELNAAGNGTPLLPQPSDPRVVRKDFEETGHISTYGVAATLTHELEGMTFKATGAYYEVERRTTQDWDGTEASLANYNDIDEIDQTSFEAQLLSNNDSALEWILGATYMEMNNFTNRFGYIYEDSPGGGGIFDLPGDLNVKSYAIYGQASYMLTDAVKATLGLRYAWDDKTSFATNTLQYPTTPPPFGPFTPFNIGTGGFDESWDKPMGRFALDWNVTDDNMLYASVARGYKAGGFQTTSVGPTPTQITGPVGIAPTYPAADPETVWSYEVGAKNYFLDRRVQFNVSAYYSETKDIQAFLFVPGALAPSFTNVSDGTAWGVEIDYMALISENLTINGSAGYMNTEYDGYSGGNLVNVISGLEADIAGNKFINAPEWSFAMGAEYVIPMDAGEFSLRADWSYRSRVYFSLFEEETESQKAYHKLDLRARFDTADGHWNATAYVNNVTDEDVVYTMILPSGSLGNSPFGYYTPPRTYGLRLGYNF